MKSKSRVVEGCSLEVRASRRGEVHSSEPSVPRLEKATAIDERRKEECHMDKVSNCQVHASLQALPMGPGTVP